jgi:integrase
MSAALLPLPAADDQSLRAKLLAAVGPECLGETFRLAPDDPVFGRDRCQVAGCRHPARARRVCHSHYARWGRQGRPDMATFVATTGPVTQSARSAWIGSFDVSRLGVQARLEIAYVIRCRQAERVGRLLTSAVRQLIGLLADAAATSMLDRPLASWLEAAVARKQGSCHTVGLVRYAYQHLRDLAEGTDAEAEFARDTWRASVLRLRGAHVRRVNFGAVSQTWLRVAVKRWARFRLGAGRAFGTVRGDVDALSWFSRFLAEQHPEVCDDSGLTRAVIEHYLSWLAASQLGDYARNGHLVCLRSFLEACRRHGWLAGLPARATIYTDELPGPARPLPRFIPEFVMAQLEDPANLARLPDDTTRHLAIVLMETGLRASDACALPFNPIIDDSVGWPCLKFFNAKMAAEQLVPLSAKAADAIRSQQQYLHHRWPDPPSRLFPAYKHNPEGIRPFDYNTLRARLARWQHDIALHDEAGQAVRVSPHQFRHTLGTRLINAGVPQHVVQKLLGHASPEMTARYATLHDATVRAAFDDYQRRRVDIHGERLPFDPEAPTADAEWVKHNLARVQASLPNGYCGRPPQQDCPHPNACLTCPDFQTTPEFLPIHRRQRDDTLTLLAGADANGRIRLADNHRQVAANLERIITALEALEREESTGGG